MNSSSNISDYKDVLAGTDTNDVLIKLLAPLPGETILEVGSDDSILAERITESGCYITKININSEKYWPFDRVFDAAYSQLDLYRIEEREPVLDSVIKVLRPKGRFITKSRGRGHLTIATNAVVKSIIKAGYGEKIPSLACYADPEVYRTSIERAGFSIDLIALVPKLKFLSYGMRKWLTAFSKPLLIDIPIALHRSIIAESENLLRPLLFTSKGEWFVDEAHLWLAATKQ